MMKHIVEILDKGYIGGSKGRRRGACPTWVSKFFRFHAVFGKIWQNRLLAPLTGEILDPILGSDMNNMIVVCLTTVLHVKETRMTSL